MIELRDAILIAGVVVGILVIALFIVDSIVWLVIKPMCRLIGKQRKRSKPINIDDESKCPHCKDW